MVFFFLKRKTAYDMRIGDWSSDVCSSDRTFLARLRGHPGDQAALLELHDVVLADPARGVGHLEDVTHGVDPLAGIGMAEVVVAVPVGLGRRVGEDRQGVGWGKSVAVRGELGGRGIIK